jgi:aminoglycoside phosphotransferase (APT) family kinase protein
MRVDALLPAIAKYLRVEIVTSLAGGEFGAALVSDTQGRKLVLKALPSPDFALRFALGAELAGRLRDRGYPAPAYAGTGLALEASWSLQEFLPGAVPDVMSRAHATRLCELAAMHAGAAGRRQRMQRDTRRKFATIEAREETSSIAQELRSVIERTQGVALLDDGVVHGDFHHRNYLAIGEHVSGVFDWELATVGDWRSDLVTLAFWSWIVPTQVPPDARATIEGRLVGECPQDIIAYFAARCSLNQLDFDAREHPDRLLRVRDAIVAHVAPWWRD